MKLDPHLSSRLKLIIAGIAALIGFFSVAHCQAPDLQSSELPRTPPRSPEEAINSFQLKQGFRIELVASEPEISDPVAISFDESGNLYVAEMRGYSERQQDAMGRITLLQDNDGDGNYETAHRFADGLKWPTAIFAAEGGVFVGATPDILFLKDLDGDHVADRYDVVFTGLGKGNSRLNVQTLVNSFRWGIDNRIHGANGGTGGLVTSSRQPAMQPVALARNDFSFSPSGNSFRLETGGGQNGMSFDDQGRKFATQNSRHILIANYNYRYHSLNANLSLPAPLSSIAADGDAAPVFRISSNEPWRVIRTQWRIHGLVPGPVEGGGRPSGYFTGATGVCVYRGDAWDTSYYGDAFIADCGSNLVHHKKLQPDGLSVRAQRADDEQFSEFLASTDNWFRPVQIRNGPDGNLYIVDMCREVIEHPWSLPESIKQHLDLNSGFDRGRIYRVLPTESVSKEVSPLSALSTTHLVEFLAHNNAWHRETAARLLLEREDSNIPSLVDQFLRRSESENGIVKALYILSNLGELDLTQLESALKKESPIIQIHALKLLESLPAEGRLDSAPWQPLLVDLSVQGDDSAKLQLAWSLGFLKTKSKTQLLVNLLNSSKGASKIEQAVLNSAGSIEQELLEGLMSGRDPSEPTPSSQTLIALVNATIRKGINEGTVEIIRNLPLANRLAAIAAIYEKDQGEITQLFDAQQLRDLAEEANRATLSSPNDTDLHRSIMDYVSKTQSSKAATLLANYVRQSNNPSVQQYALSSLASLSSEDAQDALFNLIQTQPTSLIREQAIDALLRRSTWAMELLEQVELGALESRWFTAHHKTRLLNHSNRELKAKARSVLATNLNPKLTKSQINEVLEAKVDLNVGQNVYSARCATCHQLGSSGNQFGPNFASIANRSRRFLIEDVSNPNAEVQNRYINHTASTDDGLEYSGIISSESESTIELLIPGGSTITIQKSNLKAFETTNLSAMPEGLLEGLSSTEIASLLAFISQHQP